MNSKIQNFSTLEKTGPKDSIIAINLEKNETANLDIADQTTVSDVDSEETDDEANALDISYDDCQSEEEEEFEDDAVEATGEEEETQQWKKVAVTKEEVYLDKGLTSSGKEINKQEIDTPIVIDNIVISDDDDDEEDDPELHQYLSSRIKTSMSVMCDNKPNTDMESKFEYEDEDDLFSNDVEEIDDKSLITEDKGSFLLPQCQSLLSDEETTEKTYTEELHVIQVAEEETVITMLQTEYCVVMPEVESPTTCPDQVCPVTIPVDEAPTLEEQNPATIP